MAVLACLNVAKNQLTGPLMKLKLLLGLASILGACTPQTTSSTAQAKDSEVQMVWRDVTKFSFIMEDESDGKAVKKVVKKAFNPDSIHLFYKLGNLAFVKMGYNAPQNTADASGSSSFKAVFTESPYQMIDLPDQSLLAQFITEARKSPDAVRLDRRVRTTLMLAVGNDNCVSPDRDKAHAPVWNTQGDNVELTYYRMEGRGMAAPELEKCVLNISADFSHNLKCEAAEGKTE